MGHLAIRQNDHVGSGRESVKIPAKSWNASKGFVKLLEQWKGDAVGPHWLTVREKAAAVAVIISLHRIGLGAVQFLWF
jgi:hypothetical protein